MQQAAGLGGPGLVGSFQFQRQKRGGVLEARRWRLPDLPAWPGAWGRAPSLPGVAGVRSTIHCTVEAWGRPFHRSGAHLGILLWVCRDQTWQEQDRSRGEALHGGEGAAGEEEGGNSLAPGAASEGEAGAEGESLQLCRCGARGWEAQDRPRMGSSALGGGAWTPHAAILSQGQ